jgi:hypothetical protein
MREGGITLCITEKRLQQSARGVNADARAAQVFKGDGACAASPLAPRLDTPPLAPYTLGFAVGPVFATVRPGGELKLKTRLLEHGVT